MPQQSMDEWAMAQALVWAREEGLLPPIETTNDQQMDNYVLVYDRPMLDHPEERRRDFERADYMRKMHKLNNGGPLPKNMLDVTLTKTGLPDRSYDLEITFPPTPERCPCGKGLRCKCKPKAPKKKSKKEKKEKKGKGKGKGKDEKYWGCGTSNCVIA